MAAVFQDGTRGPPNGGPFWGQPRRHESRSGDARDSGDACSSLQHAVKGHGAELTYCAGSNRAHEKPHGPLPKGAAANDTSHLSVEAWHKDAPACNTAATNERHPSAACFLQYSEEGVRGLPPPPCGEGKTNPNLLHNNSHKTRRRRRMRARGRVSRATTSKATPPQQVTPRLPEDP